MNLHESVKWSDLGFRIEETGDSSPTLRLLQGLRQDFPDGEAMHHSGGAAEETDLIYGTCIRDVFNEKSQPHFLIVGLGLGYIEMYIAKEALRGNHAVGGVRSLESVGQLRELFLAWVRDEKLADEVQQVYDQALAAVLAGSSITSTEIKSLLKQNFNSSFVIEEALQQNSAFPEKFHGIMYDAFSGKTSPELWEEDFLTQFLEKTAAPQARLATYACRGSLKRALRANGFRVIMGPGFHGKRKYTQGARP